MGEYNFSLLSGIVLLVIAGWSLISFCKTLRKSYRAIRQKEAISTAEAVHSLIKSNAVILFPVGMIITFTNEKITLQTLVISFVNAIRGILGIILLSAFCGYQVHRYNAKA